MPVCGEPGCPEYVQRGYCDTHRKTQRRQQDKRRPSASQRGYDIKWRRIRAQFLKHHPTCVDCGQPATVPDHDPVDRAELVRRGEQHPDAWQHLKPRCKRCHDERTGRTT